MLSSIWNLLVTEDELLTKIVTAPTVIVEDWIACLFVIYILKINISQRKKVCYVIVLSTISLFTEFFIPTPYNIFYNYILIFIFIKIIFKESIIKTFLFTILPTIFYALIGLFLLKPFLILLNISSEQIEITPIYKLIYMVVLYSIAFIIVTLIKNKNISLTLPETFNKKDKIIILNNLFLGFITLCIELAITASYTDILPVKITFLSFITSLAYFFVSFNSLTRAMKLKITTINLQNAENYNKTLSILYDNVKAFKHDFDNMVFTIGGFIDTNDITGLKSYYNSLEKECHQVNNLNLLNPTLINNPGIYNLLTIKYQKAQLKNVEIDFDFFFDLNKLNMPIYDFSRILGIFLDNAIEAATISKEKIIKIMFRDSSRSNIQIIQIENSYTNKNVDTNKIFKKGVTEKEQHLGMGLWEVMQILKRNNNVNLITEKNDLYFKQCLEIYY